MSFDTEVQKAVYAELVQNSELMNMCSGVFDFVDQDQKFPYLTIGVSSDVEYDTFYDVGRSVVFSVHAWTNDRGTKTNQALLDEVFRTLNRTKLNGSSDVNFITCQYESGDMFRDEGGTVWHGVQQYRILIEGF